MLKVGDSTYVVSPKGGLQIVTVTAICKRSIETVSESGRICYWKPDTGTMVSNRSKGTIIILDGRVTEGQYSNIISVSHSRAAGQSTCNGCMVGYYIHGEFIPDRQHLFEFRIGNMKFNLCDGCAARLRMHMSLPNPEPLDGFVMKINDLVLDCKEDVLTKSMTPDKVAPEGKKRSHHKKKV